MLNDYKGETPDNVIPKEQHEKRPFYKKVSFWVLSALGLFFGGCSVYGLVLGYQYVQAVTQAAHIIADANSSADVTSDSFVKKSRLNAVGAPQISCVDLGSLQYTYVFNQHGRFTAHIPNIAFSTSDNLAVEAVCTLFKPVSYNGNWDVGFMSYRYSFTTADANKDMVVFLNDDYNNVTDFKSYVTGVFLYYKTGDSFTGVGAYQQGYDEGHQDGYQEGYVDGSDAINLPQSVKVLLPEGNQYSVQYKSYVDGVVDRQGQLNSSQTGGAYATFDRSRTQKLRIDLTLPAGSRAFFLYTPSWTSAYPTDENYSLRQSWAVSGVTYLPTWISKPQIYVGVTSADVPDLTYETVSVAFDVDHWGDIKVGAYSQGYNDGYQAGEENPTAYDSGYDAGYEQGYDDGHTIGVAQGESQAVSGQKALVNMFVTAFQQPFDQIYRFLNFNVLGLNILALFTALLTLSIGIIIIKKVI